MARKPHAVSQLEHHYSRFRGDIQTIEDEIIAAGVAGADLRARKRDKIDQHLAMLDHIEACIRLFQEDWTPTEVQSVRRRRAIDPDRWGTLLNQAYDVLRPAKAPLSSREIVDALWKAKLVPDGSLADYSNRLTQLMRGQEAAGAVRCDSGRPLRWEIIRSPAPLLR